MQLQQIKAHDRNHLMNDDTDDRLSPPDHYGEKKRFVFTIPLLIPHQHQASFLPRNLALMSNSDLLHSKNACLSW